MGPNSLLCVFTDGVLVCLVAESSLSSFEQTDDPNDDNNSSTMSDELGSEGSTGRGAANGTQIP